MNHTFTKIDFLTKPQRERAIVLHFAKFIDAITLPSRHHK